MSTRGLLFQFTSTIYSSSIKQTSFHKKKNVIITEIDHILDLFILTIMKVIIFPQKWFSVNSLTEETKTTWTFASQMD
jgi:hypothetical protein